MKLSQLQLHAFQEVAKAGSLTKASQVLNLTQSALSHRLNNLEDELETSLFVRHGSGVRLTEAGTKLLRYCQTQSQAEEELLSEIGPQITKRGATLAGTLRIAGTSTLIRSVVLPSLSEFLHANPDVRIEIMTKELGELPRMIASGEADFLVTSKIATTPGLLEEELGAEVYVMTKGLKSESREHVYLDHDRDDQTTFEFLKFNSKDAGTLRRSFLDDIYGIIDGVEAGIGRAVLPKHMLHGRKKLKIVDGYKSMKVTAFIYRQKQAYYTKLHDAVFKTLLERVPTHLK